MILAIHTVADPHYTHTTPTPVRRQYSLFGQFLRLPTSGFCVMRGLCSGYRAELRRSAATLRCDAPLASFGESRTVSHRSAKAEQYRIVRRNPNSIASFGESRTVSHRSAKSEQYGAVGGRTPPPLTTIFLRLCFHFRRLCFRFLGQCFRF